MFSLTEALVAVAGEGGCAIDVDELHAALGLSLMMVAVPEEDPGSWATHARDAFLIPAGRLFGLEIREIHPPEAGIPMKSEMLQSHRGTHAE